MSKHQWIISSFNLASCRPTSPLIYQKVSSEILKELVVDVTQLLYEKGNLLDENEQYSEKTIKNMLNAKKWIREEKINIDKLSPDRQFMDGMREIIMLNSPGIILPIEEIITRTFRFENEEICCLRAETFATKTQIVNITVTME